MMSEKKNMIMQSSILDEHHGGSEISIAEDSFVTEKEEIDSLISLLTRSARRKIHKALSWAKAHEVNNVKAAKFIGSRCDSRQIAALVLLYESSQPKSELGIGHILCDLDTAEVNVLPSWLRSTFYFPKDAMYVAFTSWMVNGSSLGHYLAYDLNTTYGMMHLAASNGDNDLLKWLLSRKVDVDFRDSAKNTALHIAAEQGNKSTVIFLLQNGASMFVHNSNHHTPLDLALNSQHFDVCDILCPSEIEKMITSSKFLNIVREGNNRTLEYLLRRSKWFDVWSALLIAVESGKLKIVDTLLKHCPPVSLTSADYNNNVLNKAIANRDSIITEKLLAAGFQMNNVLKDFAKKNGLDELLNHYDDETMIDVVD